MSSPAGASKSSTESAAGSPSASTIGSGDAAAAESSKRPRRSRLCAHGFPGNEPRNLGASREQIVKRKAFRKGSTSTASEPEWISPGRSSSQAPQIEHALRLGGRTADGCDLAAPCLDALGGLRGGRRRLDGSPRSCHNSSCGGTGGGRAITVARPEAWRPAAAAPRHVPRPQRRDRHGNRARRQLRRSSHAPSLHRLREESCLTFPTRTCDSNGLVTKSLAPA